MTVVPIGRAYAHPRRVYSFDACGVYITRSIGLAIPRYDGLMHQSFENQMQPSAYKISYNTWKRRCFFCSSVWFYA